MQRPIKLPIAAIVLFLGNSACHPSGEIGGFHKQTSADRNTSTDLKNDTKSRSDRPSEEGVGLPGYSLFCSVDKIAESDVEVGCHIMAEENNERLPLQTSDWEKFEVQTPEGLAPLQVEKRAAETGRNWDVLFIFRGLTQDELIEAAMTSSYSLEWRHDNGEMEMLVAEPPAPDDTIEPINPENTLNQCSSGVAIDGVCFFRTNRSCNSSCSQINTSVHPAWSTTFGSRSSNGDATCQEIYQTLKGSIPIIFQNRSLLTMGYGCYDNGLGFVIHENGTLDPSNFAPIGGSVICACSPTLP